MMFNFKNTFLPFTSFNYEKENNSCFSGFTLTFNYDNNITYTSGSTIFYDVEADNNIIIRPVENNVLDMLSQELDVEINKETILKLLELVKDQEDDD